METTESQNSSSSDVMQVNMGFLKSRWTSTTLYILALFLFLLPFVTIRCNGEPLAKATGLDLAFGVPMKTAGTLDRLRDKTEKRFNFKSERGDKTSPNPYALIAMGLILIGAVASLLHFHQAPWLKSVIACLALISLIILQFDVNRQLHADQDPYTGRHHPGNSDLVNLHADFSAWYYLAMLILLMVTILGLWQTRRRR